MGKNLWTNDKCSGDKDMPEMTAADSRNYKSLCIFCFQFTYILFWKKDSYTSKFKFNYKLKMEALYLFIIYTNLFKFKETKYFVEAYILSFLITVSIFSFHEGSLYLLSKIN